MEGKQEAAERKEAKAEAQVIQGRGLSDDDEPSAKKGLGATNQPKKASPSSFPTRCLRCGDGDQVVCGRGNQIMDFTRGRLMSRQLLASCMLHHPLSRQRPCFWS